MCLLSFFGGLSGIQNPYLRQCISCVLTFLRKSTQRLRRSAGVRIVSVNAKKDRGHDVPPVLFWWAIRDSNPGPTGYEPVALTN